MTDVRWTRDNIRVEANGELYQQSQTITNTTDGTYESRLTIINKSSTTSGYYTCEVSNSRGSRNMSLYVDEHFTRENTTLQKQMDYMNPIIMGYFSCTAACPMRVMMLRSNVITFISTTAFNNAKYINEPLVILFSVKRTMVHYLSVSCVLVTGQAITIIIIATHCMPFCVIRV